MGRRSLGENPPAEERDSVEPSLILARRPDLRLGNALIRPSIRTVEGPEGRDTVEPRVMQVLLALMDADGAVRTREELLQTCWNGVVVGEDSLNRAIGEARRAARNTGSGFAIETIPRIGYRLTGGEDQTSESNQLPSCSELHHSPGSLPITRRRLLVGGVAGGIAGAAGVWLALRSRDDPRLIELIDRGRAALRDSLPAGDAEAVRLFRAAATLAPDKAEPWGWLALSLREVAIRARPGQAEIFYKQSEDATQRALGIDSLEPNARVAEAQARELSDGRIAYEDRLRAILDDAPNNIAALASLTSFLQAVGLTRASWDANERAISLEPIAAVQQTRRALKHWIFNRPTEADQTIDGALRRWPRHPLLWNARLLIYAFTGRPRAGLALIEDVDTRPTEETPEALEVWRVSLTALETRSLADLQAARAANIAAATRTPGAAANAIVVLAELGEVDAAYAVAEGLLLRRGRIVGRTAGAWGEELTHHPGHRRTQWLFTPATRSLREDSRFPAFCRDIGLAEYWRRRGSGPDL